MGYLPLYPLRNGHLFRCFDSPDDPRAVVRYEHGPVLHQGDSNRSTVHCRAVRVRHKTSEKRGWLTRRLTVGERNEDDLIAITPPPVPRSVLGYEGAVSILRGEVVRFIEDEFE